MRRRVACSYLVAVERHRDGELDGAGVAEFETHLASCPLCQEEHQGLERLTAVLRRGDIDGAVSKPEHERLKSTLLERCKQTLHPSGSGVPVASVSAARGRRWRNPTVWEAAAVGVIFVILVAIVLPIFGQARERARRWAATSLANGALIARRPQPKVSTAVAPLPLSPNARRFADGHAVETYQENVGAETPPPDAPSHVLRGAAAPSGPVKSKTTTAIPPNPPADSHPDRYLIKDATLTLEVKDARQASRTLARAVSTARGYVSDTHETVDELGQRSVTTKVRVPFTRFDASMQQIEALGKVLEKQITAEDVTEEFVDSQAKLRNLQRTEQRLLAHLDQTGRLPDILLVEKEVNRVRGEIEQLEGRLRFLEHRIAFSTIELTLNEAARAQLVVPASSYSSGKQASDALRSLVGFLQVIWSSVIWLAIWAVVWLPMALGIWLVYRRRRDPFLL
jgi:hypothetical protein